MDVLNMNDHPVHPRIISPEGKVDSIHIMPKRRATLPEGYRVDTNWLASAGKVSVFDTKTSRVPIRVGAPSQGLANVAAASAVNAAGASTISMSVQQAQQQAIAAAQALLEQQQNGTLPPATE